VSLTIDFIVLCVFLIIPGVIFKRFYFYNEFSKQFSIREPLYNTLFYAIIPGIVVQIIGYLLYSFVHGTINYFYCIECVKEIFSKDPVNEGHIINIHKQNIHRLFFHLFDVCVLALVLGIFLSRTVRYLNLDKKTRILRFQNNWFYLFNGEILEFKKFKPHFKNVILNKQPGQQQVLTLVDVAIEAPAGFEFYSGFLVDYALKDSDPTELDKLYLKGASRYLMVDKNDSSITDFSNIHLRGKKVNIPGHIFVLETDKLLNLNVSYVTRENIIKIEKEKEKNKEEQKANEEQVVEKVEDNNKQLGIEEEKTITKEDSYFTKLTYLTLLISMLWLWIEFFFNINGALFNLLKLFKIDLFELGLLKKITLILALNYMLSALIPNTKSKLLMALLGVILLIVFIALIY
jgi:hypothetical protein